MLLLAGYRARAAVRSVGEGSGTGEEVERRPDQPLGTPRVAARRRPRSRGAGRGRGTDPVMQVDERGRVTEFHEKPKLTELAGDAQEQREQEEQRGRRGSGRAWRRFRGGRRW